MPSQLNMKTVYRFLNHIMSNHEYYIYSQFLLEVQMLCTLHLLILRKKLCVCIVNCLPSLFFFYRLFVKSSQWHNILKNTGGQGQTCEIICTLLFSFCSEKGSVMYVEAHAFVLRFTHSSYTCHHHRTRVRDSNEVMQLIHLSLKHYKNRFKRHQRHLRYMPRISRCNYM